MEVRKTIFPAAFIFCSLLLATSAATSRDGHHLHVGFYEHTCPHAEQIASDVVYSALLKDPTLAAGLIRLLFHDCFVNGCDASILLDSTPSGEPVEKTSPANGESLRGLDVIDEIKTRIEMACPGVVSCADIMAFATRDATVFSGLPFHLVPSGRRDAMSSRAADVFGNLPFPTMTVDEMAEIFTRKGMTVDEMVVLTGAHSIGRAHCGSFDYRLYNYSSNQAQDPKLDRSYAFYLSSLCPPPSSLPLPSRKLKKGVQVHFDPLSPFRLDSSFYQRLTEQRALLQSDQALADDPKTSDLVRRMALEPKTWSKRFIMAMVRLGRVGVLTGRQGEIRKNCRAVN